MNPEQKKSTTNIITLFTELDIPELTSAKIFLNEKHNNKYTILPMHITYTIIPLHEDYLPHVQKDIRTYIQRQKPFEIRIEKMHYEPKKRFFYLEVTQAKILEIHRELTVLLNQHRHGYLRKKDVDRLQKNYYNDIQKENLLNYGYSRAMDSFVPHITLGNFECEPQEEKKLARDLTLTLGNMVKPAIGRQLKINKITAIYAADTKENQGAIQDLWREKYVLKQPL